MPCPYLFAIAHYAWRSWWSNKFLGERVKGKGAREKYANAPAPLPFPFTPFPLPQDPSSLSHGVIN